MTRRQPLRDADRIRDARDNAITMAQVAKTEEQRREWTLRAAAHQQRLDEGEES